MVEAMNTQEVYNQYNVRAEHCFVVEVPRFEFVKKNYATNSDRMITYRTFIHGIRCELLVDQNSCSNNNFTLGLKSLVCDGEFKAQVIFWQWFKGTQKTGKEAIVSLGTAIARVGYTQVVRPENPDPVFVLIRLLEPRPSTNVFDTLADGETISFRVGREQYSIPAQHIIAISPVFQRMLDTEMREKTRKEVVLGETTPEEFVAFIHATSPARPFPNPNNVRALLKLADRFQVDWMRDSCEQHLINCIEIPLVERLFVAELYNLKKLQEHIFDSLPGPLMKEFLSVNKEKLSDLSKELLLRLIACL